jgi:hypothetical protein
MNRLVNHCGPDPPPLQEKRSITGAEPGLQVLIRLFERFPPWRVRPLGSIMVLNPQGGAMATKTETQYEHLEPRPGSNYRQWFLKGRRIRAAVVDEVIHGPDPRTPEEFAQGYQVPLEAVLEALDYVARNRPLIEQEREEEEAELRARGLLDRPPPV